MPFSECPAKTRCLLDGTVVRGVTVNTHCQIVGAVARELVARKPEWLRKSLFPRGFDLVAAAHDVGKVSPGFQEKIHRAAGVELDLGIPRDLDSLAGYHWAVSQATLDGKGKFLPEIVGRHQ